MVGSVFQELWENGINAAVRIKEIEEGIETANDVYAYPSIDCIDKRKPKYSSGEINLVMSAPSSYVDPEERERRLRELANRLVDEKRVEPDTVNQTKREYANIKQDLTQEFLKFMKFSEECEMDRAILEAVVYKDIAEQIHAALKKFDNM